MHPFSILTLGIFVAGYTTARWDLVTRLYELAIFAWDNGVVVRIFAPLAIMQHTLTFALFTDAICQGCTGTDSDIFRDCYTCGTYCDQRDLFGLFFPRRLRQSLLTADYAASPKAW